MHATPDRQRKFRWESVSARLPREIQERCRRLLAQLLHDVAQKDLQHRSKVDDGQDSSDAS